MGKVTAKDKSSRASPKRGAFPTPGNVLSEATAYEPEKAGPAAAHPGSGLGSQEAVNRSDMTLEGAIMSDYAGSSTGGQNEAGTLGTPGSPPHPSRGGGTQAGSTKGVPGTPRPPSAGGLQAGAGPSQSGIGNMGIAGTPPRPASSSPAAGAPPGSSEMGTPGTPPRPSGK